ncbi:MAG: hypothetical protein IKG08_01550, partial [Eubacterium sp.]|nr:hypothetical protein [Eubacterium sp.]
MKKHSAKILTVILAASMILGSAAPSFAKAEEATPAEEVIVLESVQDEELPAAEEKNEEDVFFEAENVPEEDADTEDTLPADTQEEEEETLPADAEPEDPESVSEEDADAEDADAEEAEADAVEEEAPAEEVPAPAVKALPAAAVAEASAAFAAEAEEIAKNTGLTRDMVGLMAEPAAEATKEGGTEESFYDSEGKLKDGTYTVTMSNASRMYRQYPDNSSATVHIVSKGGVMRVSFVMKTVTSFTKLSLTDPETAKEYYLGTVGEGTAYCVPLENLSALTVQFLKSDNTWAEETTFTFDAESIAKESDDTANYPLSETEKAGQEEDDDIYDSEGKLKDGTYTVTMSNASRMYRQYPDNESAAVHIVSKDGEMRVSFVMKTTTSFGKLSLTDPESAEEYYLGKVGEGTAYCVPLANLDG